MDVELMKDNLKFSSFLRGVGEKIIGARKISECGWNLEVVAPL